MTVTQGRPSRTVRLVRAWRSGPLSMPGFRLLTFGQFTSTIGDNCYAVALPWLVLSGGGSAASLGIVLACYGIPRGADRVGRFAGRPLQPTAGDAVLGLRPVRPDGGVRGARGGARVVARSGGPVAALLGAFSALFMPASMTMMPSLVASTRLTAANAVYTGFVQAGSMLGPVIGGVLVASTGPTTAFAVDAGSYLVPRPATLARSRRSRNRLPGRRSTDGVAPGFATYIGAPIWMFGVPAPSTCGGWPGVRRGWC